MIDRILLLMNEAGITAAKLAETLQLPNSAITEWKKGKAKPSADAISKLAKYFDVSADYLLGISDDATYSVSNVSNSALAQGNYSRAIYRQGDANLEITRAEENIMLLKSIAELKDAGVLTEEEFITKKTELLSRI